jgi:hypothetical protein
MDIPGRVVPGDDGLALEWFGGGRWAFDAEGLPVLVEDGPGTAVRFVHEQHRLLELIHVGGKRLTLAWDGERITELACSDAGGWPTTTTRRAT